MMNEILNLVLSLSLSGSILAALIFAFKPLIKNKISKSVQYYIWLVVLLRLIVPFSFSGSILYNVNSGDIESSIGSVVNYYSEPRQNGDVIQKTQQEVATDQVTVYNSVNGIKSNSYNNVALGLYIANLFNQYALYLWLLGLIIALSIKYKGYARFIKTIKKANKPATFEQIDLLNLLCKQKRVILYRNPFVTTPMLIGIIRPQIIIPDFDFDETQLKNILLHEITHLKRYDITVKWLLMIVESIHWFNPLMYIIKKQINKACELACDESVIKKLTTEEKQSYGDTLILIASDQKYPIGVLQATMCEEKKGLKERLWAIMNHSKKSKIISVISVILIFAVISSAIVLGNSSVLKYMPNSPIQRIKGININDVKSSKLALPMGGFTYDFDLNNSDQKDMVVHVINWLKSDSSSVTNKTNIHDGMLADPWTHIRFLFKDNYELDLSYCKGSDPDGEITITGSFIGDRQIPMLMVEKSPQIAEFLSRDWSKYFNNIK
jgi:beta-lactamase regulating signal transducer with metallopeptidase domain